MPRFEEKEYKLKYEQLTEEQRKNLPKTTLEQLKKEYQVRKTIKISSIVIGILILLCLIFSSFKTVPSGYTGVKTRFGKVQNTTLSEGINFKLPIIEKIILMDCRTQKTDYTMEASSKDLQKISDLKVSVNYNITPETANKLYREVGTEYKSIIVEPAIYEALKSTIANYTAEELITKRNEVSAMSIEALYGKLDSRGITLTALNITDLSFSPEFDAAIEQKQITEQKTQQAKYELEKAKVENEKKLENARTESEVMQLQNEQITEKTLELKKLEIQEKLIDKWNGQFPTTMLNDTMNTLFQIK